MISGDETSSYPYKDMPLRSGIFAILAKQLFAGELMQRADIVNGVTEHHITNGGLPGVQASIPIAKKALSAMARAGQVERVEGAYGMWRFSPDADGPVMLDGLDDDDSELSDDEGGDAAEFIQPHCIYVYDFPTYAELAALRGDERWPHKIGFTRLTAEARVADQVGTALPENPRIVLTHPSPKALLLERALHAALELRGHKIAEVPGTEWFNTNPTEIQALIDFFTTPPDS